MCLQCYICLNVNNFLHDFRTGLNNICRFWCFGLNVKKKKILEVCVLFCFYIDFHVPYIMTNTCMCMVYLFPVMFLFVGFCLCSRSFLKEGPLLPDSLKQGIFLEDSPSKTVFSPRNFLQKMFCFIYFLTRFVIDLNAKIYFPFVICCCCAWVKFQAPVKIVYLVHCFTLFFIVVHCEMKKIFSLKKKCI